MHLSAFTYSIEDLEFLLCLEDIDLQRKKTGVLIIVFNISTKIHHICHLQAIEITPSGGQYFPFGNCNTINL